MGRRISSGTTCRRLLKVHKALAYTHTPYYNVGVCVCACSTQNIVQNIGK